jgi:hypothetical protein
MIQNSSILCHPTATNNLEMRNIISTLSKKLNFYSIFFLILLCQRAVKTQNIAFGDRKRKPFIVIKLKRWSSSSLKLTIRNEISRNDRSAFRETLPIKIKERQTITLIKLC